MNHKLHVTLRELSALRNWSQVEVCIASGISESTISRLWDDREWLDKIQGKTLRCLTPLFPRLREHLLKLYSEAPLAIGDDLARYGIYIDVDRARLCGVSRDQVILCMKILHGFIERDKSSSKIISLSWNDTINSAMNNLVQNDIIEGMDKLKKVLLDFLEFSKNYNPASGREILARASVVFFLARWFEYYYHLNSLGYENDNKFDKFSVAEMIISRSSYIAYFLQENDCAAAEEYASTIVSEFRVRNVHVWALATFYGDWSDLTEFFIGKNNSFENVFNAMDENIEAASDAYVLYLVKVIIHHCAALHTIGQRNGLAQRIIFQCNSISACDLRSHAKECMQLLKLLYKKTNLRGGGIDFIGCSIDMSMRFLRMKKLFFCV